MHRIGDAISHIDLSNAGPNCLDHTRTFHSRREGYVGTRIESRAVVNVDIVQSRCFNAYPCFTRTGLTDGNLFVTECFWSTVLMNTNSVHLSISYFCERL